jgi:type I restriction enzyme S subunit
MLFKNSPSRARRIVKKGDVIISTVRTYLKAIAHIDIDNDHLIASTGFAVLNSSTQIDSKYLYYLMSSQKIIDTISSLSVGVSYPAINSSELASIRIWFPDLPSEQKSIVKFLDHKTQKIDELIAKKEKLIELLKEQRAAVINHAATKGLDPHVKMKDSGIPWLGDIPEHWRIIPLKHIAYLKGRIGWQGLKQSEFTNVGPFLITGMNFKNGKINWDDCYHITDERYIEAPEIHVEQGDVLMTKDGSIGKLLYIDYLPGKVSLNSHLLIIRPIEDSFQSRYMYYLLSSQYFLSHIDNFKTGTTFFGITQEAMGIFKTVLPPKKEQTEIVEFIDKESAEIDKTIQNQQKLIELLKEYRKALISDAVTGKIDVRGFEP